MNAMTPNMFTNLSAVYRQHNDAEYVEKAGGAIASHMNADSAEQVARAALLDLSLIPRQGFRGANAENYLLDAGFPVPVSPNQALFGKQGEMILRLSQKEFWVFEGLTAQADGLTRLDQTSSPSADFYPLFCQDSHAWLMLTGRHLADIMAKVCGVDLRSELFPVGSIAQTSVARVNAIVVRHEVNSVPVFSILSDRSSAEYLWGALFDATLEFGGEAVGLSALLMEAES